MKKISDESGSVAVIVALMMVVLLGALAMVTDLGMAYAARQRLISALDAGALAGLSQIFAGSQAAANEAVAYVGGNGEKVQTVTVNTNSLTIDLTGSQIVPFYFARVLGISGTTVAAHVQAQAGALTSGTGFAPIAVVQQNFTFGQTYQLSYGAGEGSDGNYGYLALGGTGAAVFQQNLQNGYQGVLTVGEAVATEPGNMAGPVAEAVNARLAVADGCTFATATESCPRVLLLPVINTLAVEGRSTVTVVGFAAFYLDGLTGSGGHQEIVGRFLQMVVPGTVGSGSNFGLFGVRLTE